MRNEAEDNKKPRMAKVHDFLEMWQGSLNLSATLLDSCIQTKQMTAVGYILDMEEIVKAAWSVFQHDGAAAYQLSERSPLPPPFSGKDLPGAQTQILNARRIRRINRYPVDSHEDRAPESISNTEDCLNWNGDLDIRNDSEDDCVADVICHREHGNSIEDPECPEQRDVSGAPTVSRLIRPTQKSRRQADKVSMTVHAIEMRRNK